MSSSKTMDAAREETHAMELRAEEERQAAIRATQGEATMLREARLHQDREREQRLTARKQILDEMRNVRAAVQEKALSARGRLAHESSVANGALARAGKRALDAKAEAERWQGRQAEVEERQRLLERRGQDALARVQKGSQARVDAAVVHAHTRATHAQGLLEETGSVCDALALCHADQMESRERYAERSMRLHTGGAERAKQDAFFQVKTAIKETSRAHVAATLAVQKSREQTATRVAAAQHEVVVRRLECEDFLERQRVCNAQARQIATNKKLQQDEEHTMLHASLDVKHAFALTQADKKASNFIEEAELAKERNRLWENGANSSMDTSRRRADEEDGFARERVHTAKAALTDLHARCSVYIQNLVQKREEAKQVDSARVELARARTDEIMRFCQATLEECEKRCAEMMESAQNRAQSKQEYLEGRVSTLSSLAQQRIEMMQTQSAEWRQHAEQQLADFERHVEEVKSMCDERVRAEAETSEAKVRLTQSRCADKVKLASKRAAEAIARRDAADAAYEAVMARCHGAAAEARRRGLGNIAHVLEPPVREHFVSEEQPACGEADGVFPLAQSAVEVAGVAGTDTFADVASPTKQGNAMNSAGATGSTWLPSEDAPPLSGYGTSASIALPPQD